MNIPESLVTKILSGKCILFLGAGATKCSGGALGNELGKYIYDELGDIGINYKDNLARYTQMLVNSGYRDSIEEIVRKRFSSLRPSDKFCKLSTIPWKAIYTTNYDDLVEKAYNKQHFYNCIVNPISNTPLGFSGADIPLYKLNGDINTPYKGNNPLIITLDDLRANKNRNDDMILRLMKDMNDTFVFLGYSFADQNEIVMEILDAFHKSERWESIKEKYVILPNISEDVELDLKSYRINYLCGTADEFLNFVGKKSQNNYQVKLNALHNTFTSNKFLKRLQPQALQYISECFDVYNPERDYPVDSKYYYRGGQVSWGIVKYKFDISRDVIITKLDDSKVESSTDSLYLYLQELTDKALFQKVMLNGPSISGKTTAIYRCAYDLMVNGVLSLIFKQQAKYKEGILSTIYDTSKEAFIVFADDVFIDIIEIIKMLNEARRNNLPIIFVLSIRHSDWANTLSAYNKSVLMPFDVTITMKDSYSRDEASIFVDKLIESRVIEACNKFERTGYINKIQKCNNVIQVLIELFDQNDIINSIGSEYDALCEETQYAYGIVSLIYRYGHKVRWEILQRVIAEKYEFTWEDFVEKVLRNDAKGNLYDDEIQGNFYIWGRHRYICDMIVQIHFGGNYSEELTALKEIVRSCAGIETDERFVGGLIHSLLQDEEVKYTEEQIIELLNYSLDALENGKNCSYINHMKGEYYLKQRKFEDAIRCFESNVQNNLNVEYSLHSLGKTYYYMALSETTGSGKYTMHMDLAINKLFQGLCSYKKNEFYYALLMQIFDFLQKNNTLSEKNSKIKKEMEQLARKNLGDETYIKLVEERNLAYISMD